MDELPALLVPLGQQVLPALHIIDFLDQHFKHVSHIEISKSASFHEEQAILASKLQGSLIGNFALHGVLLTDIQLISY